MSGRIGRSMPEHGTDSVQRGTGAQHSRRRRMPEQVGASEGGLAIPARFNANLTTSETAHGPAKGRYGAIFSAMAQPPIRHQPLA